MHHTYRAALALLLTLCACDRGDDCGSSECRQPAAGDESGGADDVETNEGSAACDPDARPPDTSMECAAGEICRHFDDGQSLCADFGTACEDHHECCDDCVCTGAGTCVETVFIDFDDVPCESDVDCPSAASCITRNYGNKRCAYPD